jgi:hypothetical protein
MSNETAEVKKGFEPAAWSGTNERFMVDGKLDGKGGVWVLLSSEGADRATQAEKVQIDPGVYQLVKTKLDEIEYRPVKDSKVLSEIRALARENASRAVPGK